ncbi:FixH family protein [Oceanobacillus senegalensis]|uniref:FixH family protein n=1 Tax=Oceanobacillus senegalensis TaxID=1936063 RepID=UPI000A307A66|nr:FixH family protein [Oceanobacillus senegalensis]
MRKIFGFTIVVLALMFLVACGNGTDNGSEQESVEVKPLEVEFPLPEKADVGDTVELKAIVTYGDEKVDDADEVVFEYWKQGDEENSVKVESENQGDGLYTASITFESNGVYEIYAHTTARDLHTMPKKAIAVGDVEQTGEEDGHKEESGEPVADHEHGEHHDGVAIQFIEPDNTKVDEPLDLTVHLEINGEPLTNANVRYEIVHDEQSDNVAWVDTEESDLGEYYSQHSFKEAGTYTITIHVENDEGLHEHKEYPIEVMN